MYSELIRDVFAGNSCLLLLETRLLRVSGCPETLKRQIGFLKMRETAELVMILFEFITMSYTFTCDLYKALMYNNHMQSNSLSVPVKG